MISSDLNSISHDLSFVDLGGLTEMNPTLSRRAHSVIPPQVDEMKITGDHMEINGDSRVLFLLTQTCDPDPGDIHTARNRRERIK